ncbi:30S ribosomal protein S11 [Candidatus Parcubacteria bacterium]|nr:MAG: 30S ribosomal protein S11 [Candidatus Parcubacteria bacterium]
MGKKRIIKKAEEETLVVEGGQPKAAATSKAKHRVSRGVAHVSATYNNTIISITDESGNVIVSTSAGASGFKGTKKSTPFAASKVAEIVGDKAKKDGVSELGVLVKGIGSGRESAIRTLANKGFEIIYIKDVTPMPHNGPRPPKTRRV